MASTTQGIQFTHAEDTTLSIRVCPTCGITYAGPVRFFKQREEQGGSWHCPNGHSLSFTKTEADELREKLSHEKNESTWWRDRAQRAGERADQAEHRANGYKGALTKAKKRVSNGVCPCCNRTFVDLGRHMASKHPTYAEADA